MMRSDILIAVNHTPSSANAKKKGSYTSTPHVCLQGMQRANFTWLWQCTVW